MEALVDFWSLVEVTPLPEYCERLVGPNPSPVSIDIDEVANDQPVVVEDDNNNNNNSELEINDKTTSYTTDDLLSFAMEAMLEEEKVVVPLPSQKVEQEDKIPERIYHLHRSILWVRTGYFRTLLDIGQGFSEHNTDKFTLIFDDPCNVATALFDYIYTGQIQIAIPDLGDFYALADLLQVNDLPQQIIIKLKHLTFAR
ncbi:hypothetical protein BDF19DRAFT_156931 [Syncephalis fuscata]|nr:hypothetical protein BDF19DRAFT_156931 [Syncephalis fuscata]